MNTLVLAERQTIENIGELREEVLRALDHAQATRVDASGVEKIDTAAMQLLAVLWRNAARDGKPPRLDRPSSEFQRVAELLDLAGLFGTGGDGSLTL